MISILDENLKKIGILRQYTYAQYSEEFRGLGKFSVNAKLMPENLFLLEPERQFYILFDDEVFGKIDNISKDSDNQYENIISLEGILSNIIFIKRVNNGTIKFKGKTAALIAELIKNNITNDPNSSRFLDIKITYQDEAYLMGICTDIEKQITGGYLWDGMLFAMNQDNLGILFRPEVKSPHKNNRGKETNISKWDLTISAGVDRRKGNNSGNVPVVFSQSLSNIERTKLELNTRNYVNLAYIAGEGEADSRKWFKIRRNDWNWERNYGFERNEIFIDARDIQSEKEDGSVISDEEYKALIQKRADEYFVDNSRIKNYDATATRNNKRYKLGIDFNLGDWVSVIDNELNIETDAQIVSITKSYIDNSEIVDIELSYGLKRKNIISQTNSNSNSIVEIKNNIKYIENYMGKNKTELTKVSEEVKNNAVEISLIKNKLAANKIKIIHDFSKAPKYMHKTQSLAIDMKSYEHGIIIVWGRYNPKTGALNHSFVYSFVPKETVSVNSKDFSSAFFLTTNMGTIGVKYLYITNTYVKGSEENDKSYNASGFGTYDNRNWALYQILAF